MDCSCENERIVVGLRETIIGFGVENRPAIDSLISNNGADPLWRLFELRYEASIDWGAKANWTDRDMFNGKQISEQFCAADMVNITMGKGHVGQAVYTLRTKEWFCDEGNSVRRTTIDQQIVLFAGRIEIDGHTPIDWQQMKSGNGSLAKELPTPNHQQHQQVRTGPDPEFWFEKPTTETHQQERVIQGHPEQAWFRNVKVGFGPFGEPYAGNANAFHEEPAGIIK